MLQEILAALEETHMHVLGGSGTGKSKFLQALMEEAYLQNRAFCLIDWHGTLYRELLTYLAFMESSRAIYLLDLAEEEFVTAYNPFHAGGGEVSALVSARIESTIKPFGAANTDETPRLDRILAALYTFMAETGETLPNAYQLLRAGKTGLRQYAARTVKDNFARDTWEDLSAMPPGRVDAITESAINRINRILRPLPMRRMVGRPGDIDIARILDERAILLVNLNAEGRAGKESSRLVATLLLSDFLRAAISRTRNPTRYYLVLDEFQEYVTHDVAAMLDQVRKSGLNLVLANQRLGQLIRDEELADAVGIEAGIKAIFGGLDFDAAADIAQDILLPTINQRQIVKKYWGTITKHSLEEVETSTTIEGESRGAGASHSRSLRDDEDTGWESQGSSDHYTRTTSDARGRQFMLMPEYEQEERHAEVRTRDEKVSREAGKIMRLERRHCFLKLPYLAAAKHYVVQKIEPLQIREDVVRAFAVAAYHRQGSLPVSAHDQLMEDSRNAFLQRAGKRPERGTGFDPRPNTKRPR